MPFTLLDGPESYYNNIKRVQPRRKTSDFLRSLFKVCMLHAMTCLLPFASTIPSVDCLISSVNLAAKASFAAGETPFLPMIDMSTASESSLFSITTFPSFGMDASLEKLIYQKKYTCARNLQVRRRRRRVFPSLKVIHK